MGNNNEHFIVGIEKLDVATQRNIMEIIQHIVQKNDYDQISLSDNYVDVLYAGGGEICLSF